MESSRKEKIRNNNLFQNMDFDTLSFEKVKGNLCILNHGELLYRSGEISTSLFLVIQGEVNLIPSQFSSAAGSVIYSENDFFGVNEFFSKTPRRESAIALRDTYLIEFTKDEVYELIKQSKIIMTNVKESLGLTDLDLEHDIFEEAVPVVEETIPDVEEIDLNIEKKLMDEGISIQVENNKPFDEDILQKIIDDEKLVKEKDEIPEEELVNIEEPSKHEELSIAEESIKIDEPIGIDENGTTEELIELDEPPLKREEPVLEDSPVEQVNQSNDEIVESSSTEMTFEQLEKINRAAQLVNSNVKIDDVLKNIVDVSVTLCSADRGTLYILDRSKNELWSKVLQGGETNRITIKMGNGFAGSSAENIEVINVTDASADERFNDSFDKASGYVTKSVLCFPIKNRNDDVLGVIQLLNSKKGEFTKLDENFLSALSTHAAMALQNADLVEQLLKSERISSLGKMANFLIEDIRKPILVSKKYTEHLKKKELTMEIQNVVEMLFEQLNSISDFVDATSNYSQGKSILKSSDVKLKETLEDFLERVLPITQSMNCTVDSNIETDVLVNLDAKEFFQGFKHVIKNACDAMPEGGKIELSTNSDNENVQILIKDEGLGIPSGFDEKIFEPFMSFGKKTGTGLGLAVTRKIIEEHSGTISAKSNPGAGSTFIISLPIVK